MPKLLYAVPKYRKHRASGQAIVTLHGRDHYLGPHGTKASKAEYDRLVGEWCAAGRPAFALPTAGDGLTVAELIAVYWKHAQGYYVKNGQPTDELAGIKIALRFLKQAYGHTPAAVFGPLAVRALQEKMIAAGHSRGYINHNIDRIKRCLKWGVAQELVPVSVHQALLTVPGLYRGKTEAREPAPIGPVDPALVEATLPRMAKTLADMVRLHQLLGCRPGELCAMRPGDVDTSGPVWCYTPASHKTEHRGRQRKIFIGPKAQDVLRPYLLRGADDPCFRKPRSKKQFDRESYHCSVERACKIAGVKHWTPTNCGTPRPPRFAPGSVWRRPKRCWGTAMPT